MTAPPTEIRGPAKMDDNQSVSIKCESIFICLTLKTIVMHFIGKLT